MATPNEPRYSKQNFTTTLHKELIREVNALTVIRCPQKELGCQWEGELGQLERHINPGAGATSTQGCEFIVVGCAYHCGAQFQRRLIKEHEMEACPKRPIEMQVASLIKNFEIENRMLKREFDETKKMHQHSLDQVNQELGSLRQAHYQQREELREAKEVNKFLQGVNENLQRECDILKAGQKQIEANIDDIRRRTMPLPVPPFCIIMTNFNHYQVNNIIFKSDPFYSHMGGYKMAVIVRPNGFGICQGNHVSLYVILLPGEFDDQLCWPFNGRITVQAYNSTTEQWSFERVIVINETNLGRAPVSTCVDKLIDSGAGFLDFLPLNIVDMYISSANSLKIRITKIEIVVNVV
jgi:TNF receptor-associated factor 4